MMKDAAHALQVNSPAAPGGGHNATMILPVKGDADAAPVELDVSKTNTEVALPPPPPLELPPSPPGLPPPLPALPPPPPVPASANSGKSALCSLQVPGDGNAF